MENNKTENQDVFALNHFSYSRKTGKTLAMIIGIKNTIKKRGRAGVIGCEDPQPIIKKLNELGVDVKSEPIISTKPLKPIYKTNGFEEYISGYTGGEKEQTGYIFYSE